MEAKDWVIMLLAMGLICVSAYVYIYPTLVKNAYKEAGEALLRNWLNQLNIFGYITIPSGRGNVILVVNNTCQP